MTPNYKTLKPQKAVNLIRATGQRATQARIAVLDVLLVSEYALTHMEVERILEQRDNKIDRVTLYRVLDWGLNQGLVHKVTGEDRVWRFSAVPATSGAEHAHFNCTHCGQVYCLENLTPSFVLTLPEGFKLQHADVAVQGLCRHCSY